MNIKGMIQKGLKTVNKQSPIILTSMAVGGAVTTVVLAVKATPKALELLEESIEDAYEPRTISYIIRASKRELTPIEMIKICWRPYIPVILTGAFTVACIIGAQRINTRRNAAVIGMYKLADEALKEYKDAVVETVSDKKIEEIQEKFIKNKMDKSDYHGFDSEEIFETGYGQHLCYDSYSGRYFKSSAEAIRRAVNDMNFELIHHDCITLNDFYYSLGLPNNGIGYQMGWGSDIDRPKVEVIFTSHLAADGVPCLAIDYIPSLLSTY